MSRQPTMPRSCNTTNVIAMPACLRACVPACLLLLAACRNDPAPSPAPKTKPAATQLKPSPQHPHVILISLCSVRADHLSCYGYSRQTTPAIDAFAREGVLFENAVTPWPKTAPSFCSVMTGLYPYQTGVLRSTPDQRLPDEITTLAERFQAAGYKTGAFLSTPALSKPLHLDQGFPVYQEYATGQWDQVTSYSLAWLRYWHAHSCLLWVHFNNAHYPYHPDAKFKSLFVDDVHYDASRTMPLHNEDMPITLPADHPASEPVRRPDLGGIHPLAVLPERPTQVDYYVAQYDACIRGADEQIGIFLQSVRQALGDEPCIIALWTDHGEALGEHNYYFEHGRFGYEDCTHVPLIIADRSRWPAGRRVQQPVSTVDLAATLAAMTGISADGLAGVNLLDVIDGKTQRGDVFFSAGYQPEFITGVRRGNLKLLSIPDPLDQGFMHKRPVELYDIERDPTETHDLSAERLELVKSLVAALDAWKSPWWKKAVAQRPMPHMQYEASVAEQMRKLGYLAGGRGTTQPASAPATRSGRP